MMSKSFNPIVGHEFLVCETCLGFFSNRSEFEGHRAETRHSDKTALLRAVSATQMEKENKMVVFFEPSRIAC
jgi:hypothetical protein